MFKLVCSWTTPPISTCVYSHDEFSWAFHVIFVALPLLCIIVIANRITKNRVGLGMRCCCGLLAVCEETGPKVDTTTKWCCFHMKSSSSPAWVDIYKLCECFCELFKIWLLFSDRLTGLNIETYHSSLISDAGFVIEHSFWGIVMLDSTRFIAGNEVLLWVVGSLQRNCL